MGWRIQKTKHKLNNSMNLIKNLKQICFFQYKRLSLPRGKHQFTTMRDNYYNYSHLQKLNFLCLKL